MPKIKINDIDMYFEQQGKGDNMVLIAGLSADHHVWDSIYSELSKHYRVLRFDNRGAGQTDAPAQDYSIMQMANDIAALMEALTINKTYIIGHSMGGYIAQQFAIDHANKIEKLVIIASRAKPSAKRHAASGATWQQMIANGVEPSIAIKNSMSMLFADDFMSQPEQVDAYIAKKLANPYPQRPQGLAGQLAATEHYDSSKILVKIKVPTLVMGAEADRILPLHNSQFLADNIPGAQLAVIKRCGHMPQYEKPQQLLKLISEFCQ